MAEDENIVARLRAWVADILDWNGTTMRQWDHIRELVAGGSTATLPRDIFESIVQSHAEEMAAAADEIERLRAEVERLRLMRDFAALATDKPIGDEGPGHG